MPTQGRQLQQVAKDTERLTETNRDTDPFMGRMKGSLAYDKVRDAKEIERFPGTLRRLSEK